MTRKLSVDGEEVSAIVKGSSTFKPVTHESFLPPEHARTRSVKAIHSEFSIDLHEGNSALTAKALLGGMIVGIFCNFLALYYNLKVGVVPSLNILSGLGGFLLVKLFLHLRIFRGFFTPQENAIVQTVATACYAVSSTGIGFGAGYLAMSYQSFVDLGGEAFPGNRLEDTFDLTWPRNVMWCLCLVYFGIFLAFPLRDYIILKQKLTFPSGTVTAYVIKNMHSRKTDNSMAFALMAKFFAVAFCVGVVMWIFEGLDEFPIFGYHAMQMYKWSINFDVGSVAIGSILPLQVSLSMLLGSVLTYGILEPYIATYQNGPDKWVDLDNLPGGSEYLGLQCYAIFSGLAVMLVCGVYTIVMLFYTLYRDYRLEKQSLANRGEDSTGENEVPMTKEATREAILIRRFRQSRVPVWIPVCCTLGLGALAIILLNFQFKVYWYQTLVALLTIPLFAFSNVQGIGRTDWDTSSSYGKLMMFPFGAWNYGGSIIPSLALCSVTISGCSTSGSLLQDFKTAYLLGTPPHLMFLGQLFGITVGCFMTPSIFALLSSTFTFPNTHGGAFLEGRYGTIYRTLAAIATGSGFSALPKNVLWIALGYLLFALLCLILETALPEKYACYVPNASGMSIGILIGPYVALQFTFGGLMAWWWMRWDSTAVTRLPYIASGCVAGSGIAVVVRCLLSLVDLKSPVHVSFADKDIQMHPAQWFAVVVLILVVLSVFACGSWYWHQCPQYRDATSDSTMAAAESRFMKSHMEHDDHLVEETETRTAKA